jgi:hypothetical protein
LSPFYMFTSSSCSKELSNFSNSSKSKSFSISSTKLEGGLLSILKSFAQFFHTKISLSKLFNCKWHLLNFVSMLAKEKVFSISICDPRIPKILMGQKTNRRKHSFMFSPPLKKTFDFFGNIWKINNSLVTSFVIGSLVLGVCSKYQNQNLHILFDMHIQL